MTNEKPQITGSELCTIRIMFPVESDEQAIDCKKKIKEALSDIDGINFDFHITTIPTKPAGM